MDFFKFKSATTPTTLDQGEHINGIKKSMWVERYAVPGEFSFEAPLSSGLKDFLPIGTLISHSDSMDIMIVENHQIKEAKAEDPWITVTGRSFTSFLENRIVGMNAARSTSILTPYNLSTDYSWNQLVFLINHHIDFPVDSDDELVDVTATTTVTGTSDSVPRTIEFGNLWDRVAELLKVDDLGIKTIRKNTFGLGVSGKTAYVIYAGVDRSDTVFFSWKSGDLDSAEYLFTNKNLKNSALVRGQYVSVMVDIGPVNYDRRMMIVDATDIDGHLGAAPSGTGLTDVENQLIVRGIQALLSQTNVTLTQTDISKTTKYQYRRDFNVGDFVSLDGNFGSIAVMRIVEYAEIEDETGESGHPTLAIPGV